jgi:hypothetical protein
MLLVVGPIDRAAGTHNLIDRPARTRRKASRVDLSGPDDVLLSSDRNFRQESDPHTVDNIDESWS